MNGSSCCQEFCSSPGAAVEEPMTTSDFITLVKYNPPFVATFRREKKAQKAVTCERKSNAPSFHFPDKDITQSMDFSTFCDNQFDSGKLKEQETVDVLDIIIPPITWKVDGVSWMQTVSSTPATRRDVRKLSEIFDQQLKDHKARETGIDHYRRRLYTQLFDELIRQCTIECAEHGLLLLRIRNEIQLTFRHYEALYASATAYGIRNALKGQKEKEEIKRHAVEDSTDIEELKKTVTALQQSLDDVNAEHARRKLELKAERDEEFRLKREEQDRTKMLIWTAVFPKGVAPPVN